jgi:hypothetical protein
VSLASLSSPRPSLRVLLRPAESGKKVGNPHDSRLADLIREHLYRRLVVGQPFAGGPNDAAIPLVDIDDVLADD